MPQMRSAEELTSAVGLLGPSPPCLPSISPPSISGHVNRPLSRPLARPLFWTDGVRAYRFVCTPQTPRVER